jgi:natural product biosynthesis luciferase-like monooxygenase protein
LKLRFGAYSLPGYHPDTDGSQGHFMRNLLDLLAQSEPLGFDAIWLNEHHFHAFGGMAPSLPVMLAALAQRTRRVTLGTSVIVLPLHNPIHVAEQMMMLDLMSHGRVQLGVGRGTLIADYIDMGVPAEDAQGRVIDGLELVLKAWSGERFSHHGPHYHVEHLTVWPSGEQRPHPPVWISCSKTASSFEWTGQRGYNLLTVAFPQPVATLAGLTKLYRDAWNEAGHQGSWRTGTLFHIVVAEDGGRARKLARGAFERFRAELLASRRPGGPDPPLAPFDPDELIAQGRMLAGNPREIAATLAHMQREIGFTDAILMFQLGGLSFDLARESMALFAAEVMPAFR